MAMDRFTQAYTVVLVLLLVALVLFWAKSAWQPEVGRLNQVLKDDAMLAEYSYPFRVKSFDNGLATIWSPRSFEVPAMRFLAIIHPELANLDQDDPRMRAAQQALIDHQKRAQGLIAAQDGVERVDWALDTAWLADRGVVPAAPSPR